MRRATVIALCGAVLVAATFSANVVADNKTNPSRKDTAADNNAAKRTARNTARRQTPIVLTPEREAAARTFVRQHHPSLAALLVELKKANEREYQRAMRDLFRTSERLANMRQSDQQRYDLEIKLWKTQSRVQLLVARLRMSGGDNRQSLRAELATELKRQAEVRVEILRREREKLTVRLEKIDQQIENYTTGSDEYVEKQLRLLDRNQQRQKADPNKLPSRTTPVKTRSK